MKSVTILLVAFLLFSVGVVDAAIEACINNAAYNNVQGQFSGYMFPYVFMGASNDTTYAADTSSQSLFIQGCKKLNVQYQFKMIEANCIDNAFDGDSVQARLAYIWSNDGTFWFRLDSSAAITDSSIHSDTLTPRPYKYLQIIAYPSRNQTSIADSTGHSPDGLNYYIPDNAYYRRLQYLVTPVY